MKDYGSTHQGRGTSSQGVVPRHAHSCGRAGYDAPILLLTWLLSAEVFVPLAWGIMASIAVPLCLIQAAGLFCVSRGRGRLWCIFTLASGALILAAVVAGLLLRPSRFVAFQASDGRVFEIPPQGYTVLYLAVVLVSLVFVILLSCALDRAGVRIIGSSGLLQSDEDILWRPHAAAMMDFGIHMVAIPEEYPEEVSIQLLAGRCFWSGEPIYDYSFHVANTHLVFGCLFCHPAHPYEKYERLFVLLNVVCLIVFPVAAFSVVMGPGLPRTILQMVLVVMPRNVLKGSLKYMGMADQAALMASRKKRMIAKIFIESAAESQADLIARQGAAVRLGRWWRRKVATKKEFSPNRFRWGVRSCPAEQFMVLSAEEKMELRKALCRELCFLAGTTLFTGSVIVCCCAVLHTRERPILETLAENCDGLFAAFYLDLLLDIVMPRFTKEQVAELRRGFLSTPPDIGFFGVWLAQRDLEAKESEWHRLCTT
mmetsp:Transcript_107850/g.300706  ORF Transcript_107850/g.300706 Transcript_107850/m.300706 type:complete len:483 (+) Transcript_107850:184-1632(+)